MDRRFPHGVLAAGLFGLLLGSGPAWSADTPVLGDGPPQGRPLSLAQLRACLDLQPELEQQSERITSEKAELDAAKAEFDRFEARLTEQRASLDATDKAAVDAYNAQLDRRRAMVADYGARLPAFSERAQAYNALRQSWARDCDDRPYAEADYATIHRER